MSNTLALLGVPPAAAEQWRALADAIATAGPPLCETGTVLPVECWWSTAADDVELAVAACWLCPVMLPCAAYALAARERFGVWGGTTPAERRS